MLSRRNVRVKVMQVLYGNRQGDGNFHLPSAIRHYAKLVDDSFQTYIFNLLFFQQVIAYAQQDEIRRQSKLRPTDKDTQFSAKLYQNPLAESLKRNTQLTVAFAKARKGRSLDADLVRTLYVEYAKTPTYQAYIYEQANSELKDHIAVYLDLYKFLINHETFVSVMEDHFPLWSDDKSLVVGAMKKTLKALPIGEDFLTAFLPPEETIKTFGEELLRSVISSNSELLGIIEPNLKNWDAERVAILDMIILKMALTEFLHFSSIPTKVTLNEFVELAKLYSTDKSKDFINGILDRLLKQLTENGMIKKKGRGLVE